MSHKGILLAHKKSLKKSYKHLTVEQKKIIKALEEKEHVDRFYYAPISGFFATCPKREGTKAVDWSKIDDRLLDLVDQMEKRNNKANRILDRFSESEINLAITIFKQTQFSYSQSF